MLHYWLNQRLVTARMAEPHSLAEFELHRVVFEASQSPFLRAASGLVEFALAAAISARRTAGVEDFAAAKAQLYDGLVTAIEEGSSEKAEQAMGEILLVDRPWILGTPPR